LTVVDGDSRESTNSRESSNSRESTNIKR
jgi:hypothetical protein